jgi:cytochrome c556
LAAPDSSGKWDDAKEYAKTLSFFGENLGKNKPPKGEADSWEKLTKKYAESTKAVSKAVDDKDASAVNKALDSIGGSCMECHKSHR